MDDCISRQAAIKAFTFCHNGERIPEHDCDNFPVEVSIRTVKKILNELPSVHQWIPVSKSLPETIGEYQITVLSNPSKHPISTTGVYSTRYKEFGTFRFDGTWEKFNVIAWMPMIEPYKGEKV